MRDFATLDSKNRHLSSNTQMNLLFILLFAILGETLKQKVVEMLTLVSKMTRFANGANESGCYDNEHLIGKEALTSTKCGLTFTLYKVFLCATF